MSLVNVFAEKLRGRLARPKRTKSSKERSALEQLITNSTWVSPQQSRNSTSHENPSESVAAPRFLHHTSAPAHVTSEPGHQSKHRPRRRSGRNIPSRMDGTSKYQHAPVGSSVARTVEWLIRRSPFRTALSKAISPASSTCSLDQGKRRHSRDFSQSRSLFGHQVGEGRSSDMSQDPEVILIADSDTTDQISRIVLIAGPEHFYHLALQLETSPELDLQLHGKDLFIRSAGLGYAPAQFKLGICYELGLTHFPADPSHSFAWYKRAAIQGHADAELAVSGWYLTGHPQGLVQSEHLAYEWASKAARRGWSKAEYTLGHYHEVGIWVQPDLQVAKQWYLKAAARGNERALLRLLVGHVGLAVDYTHLKDALLHHNGSNPYLIHQLAQFHELREYGLVPDEDAAFELYETSAQANYAPAQYKLGACYEFGILGCPQDPVQAVHWYSQGADNGHVEALLALAGFYLDGSAGRAAEQSDEEAFRFVKAAAQRGVPKAEYITGFFLEYGLGVEKNIAEARQWYHLACAKGVDSAERRLQDLEKVASKNKK